jgi:U4/U6.U5 tri-snRNP-associated protein 3
VSAAPVSFKVKGQDRREDSHPTEPQPRHGSHDSRDERHQRDEEEYARGRFDDPMEEDDDDLVVEEDGMDAMQAMLGFGGFGTTKNQKVLGNNAGAVRKEKKTEYRQYMNRVGGFNRPLSPTR